MCAVCLGKRLLGCALCMKFSCVQAVFTKKSLVSPIVVMTYQRMCFRVSQADQFEIFVESGAFIASLTNVL
jgi:hypothetical protein